MEFIPASSPKHVPLFLEESAQLDLLRILGKAGVSLQIQDKIIDWACHYALVNKPHNGGGDSWIRRTFSGREPFLKNLAEKVGTTGHRPHICNDVKRGEWCGQVTTPWLITLATRLKCLCSGSRDQYTTSQGLVD